MRGLTAGAGPLQEVLKYNYIVRAVSSVPILNHLNLSETQKHELIEKTPLELFKQGEAIVKEVLIYRSNYIYERTCVIRFQNKNARVICIYIYKSVGGNRGAVLYCREWRSKGEPKRERA